MPLPDEPLDRFLIRAAGLSKPDAHRALHARRVAVGGMVTQRYRLALAPSDQVTLDGVDLGDPPDRSVLICHKPAGLACSHAAQDGPLIYDAVPPPLRHPDLNTVGRLDRNTTGLLLLTCDGRFLKQVADPERHLAKRYRIVYAGVLVADAVARCATGLVIDGYPTPCRPAPLTLDGPDRATLVLTEGRHHQVKRMIASLGGTVTALHRDRVGGLALPDDLAPGAMRPLAADERAALWTPPAEG